MKQVWSDAELNEHWLLTQEDYKLLRSKTELSRLALALQLKHYQLYARFPNQLADIAPSVVEYVSFQIDTVTDGLVDYNCNGRTSRQHRRKIFSYLKVRPFDKHATGIFRTWLIDSVFPESPEPSYLDELITDWLLRHHYDRPGNYRLERHINSAERAFEQRLFQRVCGQLDPIACLKLDSLLDESSGVIEFSRLCADIGSASLESVLRAMDQLEMLRRLEIPADILEGINPKLLKRYQKRAHTENAWELRRHPAKIRYALMVFYCVLREGEITDRLVELLIQVIHKISVRAERKIVSGLVKSIVKVHGKTTLLYRIAEAVLDDPDSVVRDVIFPVVNEQTIEQLVAEFRSSGPNYVKKIHTKIRTSYAQHYRRMLPRILEGLEFRSNNAAWRSILDAIDVIKVRQDQPGRYFAAGDVPIDGVVRKKWHDIVIEEAPDGTQRINRINYEICVLQALREKLRCKEVWVVGAKRFCNPDDDLPTDFEINRQHYYEELQLPTNAETFITQLKDRMSESLSRLNQMLPRNRNVSIKQRQSKATISVSPLNAQADPHKR